MSTTFRITFLGTSAAVPTVRRNVSATLVAYQDLKWLIDCGEGTQRQIMRTGAGFKNLTHIVLSHEHLDHILGIGGLLATFNMLLPVSQVTVFGSPATLERVRQLASFIGRSLQYKLHLQPIEQGLVFSHRQLECYAFPTRHRLKRSYGFIFQEKPKRRFLAEVAERLGIPAGPERRRLLAGESVQSPTGRWVHPDEVLAPPVPGKKLVYISDTLYFPELSTYAAEADCLIAEATFLSSDAELAAEVGHMTAAQAATVARDAGAKRLYLNHLSQRYAQAEHLILEEARHIFPDTHLASDLLTVEV
ncbi:MAG: ribonuclease Z [Candidatus Tectimicrobiota bacterium]|nr:MAG: ribonuclease Z [Candidatus Tectomicrobia bacterium]